MERDDDLVMVSTTDTPEQIREGLGLPPEPGVETPAAADLEPTADPAVEEVAPEPVAEVPVVAAPVPAAVVPVAGKKPTRPTQKELDRTAAAARREAEKAAEILRAENEALKNLLHQATVPTAPSTKPVPADPAIATTFAARRAALGPKPLQTAYAEYDEFETARDEWLQESGALRAEERIAHQGAARGADLARQTADRAASVLTQGYEAAKLSAAAKHADYVQVMKAADAAGIQIGPNLRQPILESGEAGGELTYFLAQPANRQELARLNGLTPVAAALAIGKLAHTLMSPPDSAKPRTPLKFVSRAPEPQGTELSAASSVIVDDLEAATSQQEYNRMREKQIAGRRGRR